MSTHPPQPPQVTMTLAKIMAPSTAVKDLYNKEDVVADPVSALKKYPMALVRQFFVRMGKSFRGRLTVIYGCRPEHASSLSWTRKGRTSTGYSNRCIRRRFTTS
jgi:hypothetical protein